MVQETYDHDATGEELAPGGEPASSRSDKRPGCVTAYAVFLGLGAALYFGGIVFAALVAVFIGDTTGMSVGAVAIQLAVAGLCFVMSRGLWRLRNWARIAVIVVQSVGIVFFLLRLVASWEGRDASFVLGAAVISVVINGYFIYWFVSHGEYFN